MADVEEVGAALKAAIAALIYPDGTSQPSTNNLPTRIMQGWPQANMLNAWLPPGKDAGAVGGVLISVYEQPNMSTNVTRFQEDWEALPIPALPLAATLASGVVTFSGVASTQVNIVFRFGLRDVVLSLTGSEGYAAADVADAAAVLLTAQGRPATVTGPSLTCDGLSGVALAGVGTLIREVARQRQGFQITIWAPNQAARAATAKAFMAGLFGQNAVSLPDGTKGMLFLMRENNSDESQAQALYRRDVFANVEYAITEAVPGYGVVTIPTPITSSLSLP